MRKPLTVHGTEGSSNREIVVDGTDPLGNPSPLDPFEDRRFNTVVVIQSQASASAGVLELKKRVTLNGLKVIRNLGNDTEIASFQQPVVRVSDGGDRSRVTMSLIDGGAGARTGATGQSIKDCIDVNGTQTTSFAEGAFVEQTELRNCYSRGLRVRQGHVTVRDSWVHHNHLAGLLADATKGDLRTERNLIERNGWNQSAEVTAAAAQVRVFQATALADAASLASNGDVIRNGASAGAGILFGNNGEGTVTGSFVCNTGDFGIRTDSDPGEKATIAVRGTAAVLSDRGVSIEPIDPPNINFGTAGNLGSNAFAANGTSGAKNQFGFNAPAITPTPSIDARGNQWESCGPGLSCVEDCTAPAVCIRRSDVEQGSGSVNISSSSAHRNLSTDFGFIVVSPRKVAKAGSLVTISFSSGQPIMNTIDAYLNGPATCETLGGQQSSGGNQCEPLIGTCIEFEDDAGNWREVQDILAITPTTAVVRSPIACSRSRRIQVRRQQAPGGGPQTITFPDAFCQ